MSPHAVEPAVGDEARYRNRLMVAYVESLSDHALSADETGRVIDAGSLREALSVATIGTDPAIPTVAEVLSHDGHGTRWLILAAGLAAILTAIPVTAL